MRNYTRRKEANLHIVSLGGGNNYMLAVTKKCRWDIDRELFRGTKKQCSDVARALGRFEDSKSEYSYKKTRFWEIK